MCLLRAASSCLVKKETACVTAKKIPPPRARKPTVTQLSDFNHNTQKRGGGVALREGGLFVLAVGAGVGASPAPIKSKYFAVKDLINISLQR